MHTGQPHLGCQDAGAAGAGAREGRELGQEGECAHGKDHLSGGGVEGLLQGLGAELLGDHRVSAAVCPVRAFEKVGRRVKRHTGGPEGGFEITRTAVGSWVFQVCGIRRDVSTRGDQDAHEGAQQLCDIPHRPRLRAEGVGRGGAPGHVRGDDAAPDAGGPQHGHHLHHVRVCLKVAREPPLVVRPQRRCGIRDGGCLGWNGGAAGVVYRVHRYDMIQGSQSRYT
mmetsp:Transcript_8626/g.21240  ORF Transcript_8626/g.21240 Transcript_8626/m.21240 type:complete len:225 (+) Transcript_8626:198-872(+)